MVAEVFKLNYFCVRRQLRTAKRLPNAYEEKL
jgi:hypothetical protein